VEIVRKNFALKVLAVALAIVGWAYFRVEGNPIGGSPQLDQLSVPISAVNLPVGFVAHFADHSAVLTVATKRGDPPIKPEEIKAVLDLSTKETGVYNVPVTLVAPDVAVQSLSPASVTLTIEKIEARSFPVTVHYVGAASGIVVSQSAILPGAAVVRAPTSVLTQISAVHADVTMPDSPKAVDEMVRPVAVGSSGTEIAGVSVAPNLVRVQAHFVAGTGASK
jgi:hypothetical protein